MFSLRVDQNIKIFVIILTICLYFVCLGARCITKALEPVPHPVWQHICEQWGPAFCIFHGLLHDRGPSMLQHRQPHGDSKRKEFSQSGDHHPPIRQPVHVRDSNSLTFRRTASWRGPLTEMCVRRGLLDIHLVTLDYRHPEAFSWHKSHVYGWELEKILYFIWNIKVTWTFSMMIQWNTLENITHCQSFRYEYSLLKWRCPMGETMNLGSHPNEAFFFMALCCFSEGWATLMHWVMDSTSMDLWNILAQRTFSRRKE